RVGRAARPGDQARTGRGRSRPGRYVLPTLAGRAGGPGRREGTHRRRRAPSAEGRVGRCRSGHPARQAHRAPPRPGRRELITAPNARVLRCAAAALALAAVAGVTALAHAADGPTADDLRAAVTPGSTLRVDGQPLRTEVLRDFYTSLDFGLVWGSEPDGVARTGLA